jgi:hypothetical protein
MVASRGFVLWLRRIGLALSVVAVAGCGPRSTGFRVTDYRDDGAPQEYYEAFDECYYCVDARGHADIVARRHPAPTDASVEPITQVIHIRQVWSAIPGRTFANTSMINATVSYFILSHAGGAAFDGGGFITFFENRKGTEIRGKLESSDLTPREGFPGAGDLFSRAVVTGQFRATHDERRARDIMHEMQRQFGPKPAYEPPPGNPDLR